MRDEALEELQIGCDPLSTRFPQGASHASNRLFRRVAPGGDLHERRVVERADHRSCVGAPGVDPDAEAGRALAGGEPPVSRRKAVRRVLGRHAALERMPREGNRVLRRHTGSGIADLCPAGDPQLRLDNVDSRDFLSDSVLDLQTRIEFDEVERLRVSVEEKLDGPGLGVVGGTRQRERRVAEPPALGLGQIRRRRPLDHLLMAALDGAIALE